MDDGSGSKTYFADAAGKPVPRPGVNSQVASPINLLNPDRYEFYTFDDTGDLVKRLMTLDEIQGIIAGGDGDSALYSDGDSDELPDLQQSPELRVKDVVANIQSVVKGEMEQQKKQTGSKPVLDTPDVSATWSMILPAVFGNTGGDIVPERHPQFAVTPETDMLMSAESRQPDRTTATPELAKNYTLVASVGAADKHSAPAPTVFEKIAQGPYTTPSDSGAAHSSFVPVTTTKQQNEMTKATEPEELRSPETTTHADVKFTTGTRQSTSAPTSEEKRTTFAPDVYTTEEPTTTDRIGVIIQQYVAQPPLYSANVIKPLHKNVSSDEYQTARVPFVPSTTPATERTTTQAYVTFEQTATSENQPSTVQSTDADTKVEAKVPATVFAANLNKHTTNDYISVTQTTFGVESTTLQNMPSTIFNTPTDDKESGEIIKTESTNEHKVNSSSPQYTTQNIIYLNPYQRPSQYLYNGIQKPQLYANPAILNMNKLNFTTVQTHEVPVKPEYVQYNLTKTTVTEQPTIVSETQTTQEDLAISKFSTVTSHDETTETTTEQENKEFIILADSAEPEYSSEEGSTFSDFDYYKTTNAEEAIATKQEVTKVPFKYTSDSLSGSTDAEKQSTDNGLIAISVVTTDRPQFEKFTTVQSMPSKDTTKVTTESLDVSTTELIADENNEKLTTYSSYESESSTTNAEEVFTTQKPASYHYTTESDQEVNETTEQSKLITKSDAAEESELTTSNIENNQKPQTTYVTSESTVTQKLPEQTTLRPFMLSDIMGSVFSNGTDSESDSLLLSSLQESFSNVISQVSDDLAESSVPLILHGEATTAKPALSKHEEQDDQITYETSVVKETSSVSMEAGKPAYKPQYDEYYSQESSSTEDNYAYDSQSAEANHHHTLNENPATITFKSPLIQSSTTTKPLEDPSTPARHENEPNSYSTTDTYVPSSTLVHSPDTTNVDKYRVTDVNEGSSTQKYSNVYTDVINPSTHNYQEETIILGEYATSDHSESSTAGSTESAEHAQYTNKDENKQQYTTNAYKINAGDEDLKKTTGLNTENYNSAETIVGEFDQSNSNTESYTHEYYKTTTKNSFFEDESSPQNFTTHKNFKINEDNNTSSHIYQNANGDVYNNQEQEYSTDPQASYTTASTIQNSETVNALTNKSTSDALSSDYYNYESTVRYTEGKIPSELIIAESHFAHSEKPTELLTTETSKSDDTTSIKSNPRITTEYEQHVPLQMFEITPISADTGVLANNKYNVITENETAPSVGEVENISKKNDFTSQIQEQNADEQTTQRSEISSTPFIINAGELELTTYSDEIAENSGQANEDHTVKDSLYASTGNSANTRFTETDQLQIMHIPEDNTGPTTLNTYTSTNQHNINYYDTKTPLSIYMQKPAKADFSLEQQTENDLIPHSASSIKIELPTSFSTERPSSEQPMEHTYESTEILESSTQTIIKDDGNVFAEDDLSKTSTTRISETNSDLLKLSSTTDFVTTERSNHYDASTAITESKLSTFSDFDTVATNSPAQEASTIVTKIAEDDVAVYQTTEVAPGTSTVKPIVFTTNTENLLTSDNKPAVEDLQTDTSDIKITESDKNQIQNESSEDSNAASTPTTGIYQQETETVASTQGTKVEVQTDLTTTTTQKLESTQHAYYTTSDPTPSSLFSEQVIEPVRFSSSPKESLGLLESTVHLDADIVEFTDLCNELAFKYWQAVTSKGISASRGVVMSPFAVTSLLAMMFMGARGATSEEMNEILKLDDMVTFNPHLVFRNVTESIEVSKKSGVATSAFVRELFSDRTKVKLLGFYKQRAQQFYGGHVEEVNYNVINDIVRRRTNLLVKRQTWGRVPEYLKSNMITLRPPLAALSANIFQTDCSLASSKERDGEMFFMVLPSSRQRKLVPIPAVVYRSGFIAGYDSTLDATGLSIGGPDKIISTIFVIPGQQGQVAPGDNLERLEKRLIDAPFKERAWYNLMQCLLERPGLEAQIPRFSHRSIINATTALQRMGLDTMFNPDEADLRGLNGMTKDLYFSDMLQVNTFTTCGEDSVDDFHHVELYPASGYRSNREVEEEEKQRLYREALRRYEEVNRSVDESLLKARTADEPRDYQRAFHDPVHDPSYLYLPLALRPRQARDPGDGAHAPRLRLDRPFLYFVRHNPTGLILHMGRFNPRLLP